MPSIQKVDSDIETIQNSLSENTARFELLMKRLAFLCNYKVALEEELIERKKKYSDILVSREKERVKQKERGFPIPEPIFGEVDLMESSCTWDPWLCVYVPDDWNEDMDMAVPSKLNMDYELGHYNVSTDQLLKDFLNSNKSNV